MPPLTPWQRFVSKLLPWFDPDTEEAKAARADRLVEQVGRIESIRVAYRDVGKRMEIPDRRARPRL